VAILFSLVAMMSTSIGGLVAIRMRDRLHLVLGAAAGVLLGVAAFDLLPEALAETPRQVFGVPAPLLAAIAGFFCVHVLERAVAIHRGHESGHGRAGHTHGDEHDLRSVGVLAGSGLVLHSFLDGLGLGIAFQAGAGVGLAVAIAVVAHDFADGFNTVTITSLYGNARRRALTLLAADALAPVAGAVVGSLIDVPPSAEGWYLGYFAGFLLYLATSDILPEAHAHHPSRMTLVATVLGAAAMWVVVGLSS
jgi:zinc transporter, ZIP family